MSSEISESPDDEVTPAVPEPPWWTARKPGRRRQPLSRDQIVNAALRILDAEGADALTVRRLGEELNTGSATLYWHISGKDELAELVYDHAMGEIDLPDPDPARWQEQFKQLGRQVYSVMLRHRDLVRLSIGRIPVGPNMLQVIEWSLVLLRAAGLPDHAAGYAGDIFGRYLDASVLEVTATGGPPPEQVGRHFAALPAERFPNMAAISEAMFAGSADDRFEFGLDLIIRGLASYVEKPA
jgi:AcrR family transcriptional regulator